MEISATTAIYNPAYTANIKWQANIEVIKQSWKMNPHNSQKKIEENINSKIFVKQNIMYNKDMNKIEAFISNYNPSISTNSRDRMELN